MVTAVNLQADRPCAALSSQKPTGTALPLARRNESGAHTISSHMFPVFDPFETSTARGHYGNRFLGMKEPPKQETATR